MHMPIVTTGRLPRAVIRLHAVPAGARSSLFPVWVWPCFEHFVIHALLKPWPAKMDGSPHTEMPFARHRKSKKKAVCMRTHAIWCKASYSDQLYSSFLSVWLWKWVQTAFYGKSKRKGHAKAPAFAHAPRSYNLFAFWAHFIQTSRVNNYENDISKCLSLCKQQEQQKKATGEHLNMQIAHALLLRSIIFRLSELWLVTRQNK
jgi:hypothetical protein